jgi:hypothetical protein
VRTAAAWIAGPQPFIFWNYHHTSALYSASHPQTLQEFICFLPITVDLQTRPFS